MQIAYMTTRCIVRTGVQLVPAAMMALALTSHAQSTLVNFEDSQLQRPDAGFIITYTGNASPVALATGGGSSWKVEGTSGSNALGFWGNWTPGAKNQGYTGAGDTNWVSINFVVPNTSTPSAVDVSFDLLEQATQTASYVFYGFKDGNLVSTNVPTLASVVFNTYSEKMASISFSGIDEIRLNSNGPGGLDNFVFSTSAVPEPSSIALAALGAAGLLQLRRRK